MVIKVPGKVFYAIFDSNASMFSDEVGLPAPEWRKVGRGRQAVYEVDEEMADEMLHHAYVWWSGLEGEHSPSEDPEGYREVLAVKEWWGRTRSLVPTTGTGG